MSIEEKIKSVWPAGLGTCRFGKAEHSDEVPYTVIFLVSNVAIHNDGGRKMRYQADIYLNKIDTELIRQNIFSITHSDITMMIDNISWEYTESLKKYRHIVDIMISTTWQ